MWCVKVYKDMKRKTLLLENSHKTMRDLALCLNSSPTRCYNHSYNRIKPKGVFKYITIAKMT